MMDEFITALEEGKAYDFIANNYWQMNKENLKDILLEFIYEADESVLMDRAFDTDNIVAELEDRYGLCDWYNEGMSNRRSLYLLYYNI